MMVYMFLNSPNIYGSPRLNRLIGDAEPGTKHTGEAMIRC